MRDSSSSIKITVLGIVLTLMLSLITHADSPSFIGKVKSVISGDRLIVDRNGSDQKVRLCGAITSEANQPYSEEGKAFTIDKILGKSVRVEAVDIDADGTLVGNVCPQRDGFWVSAPSACLEEELVKSGLAVWDKILDPHNRGLKALEAEAREGKRGIWKESNVLPVWFQGSRVMATAKSGNYQQEHGVDRFLVSFDPLQWSWVKTDSVSASREMLANNHLKGCTINLGVATEWELEPDRKLVRSGKIALGQNEYDVTNLMNTTDNILQSSYYHPRFIFQVITGKEPSRCLKEAEAVISTFK